MQEKVGLYVASKAFDGGRVEGDAEIERALKLRRRDGHVFLAPENVAEREADKLYLLFLYILYDFLCGISHF
jgi:hypothetical protein